MGILGVLTIPPVVQAHIRWRMDGSIRDRFVARAWAFIKAPGLHPWFRV